MCPILDGYGVIGRFLIPVHALVWTASNSWSVIYSGYGCRWRHKLSLNCLRATRAVHNREAACVAAGGGIFENQL